MLRQEGREGREWEGAGRRRGGLAARGSARPGSRLGSLRSGRAVPTRPARRCRRLRPPPCTRRPRGPTQARDPGAPQPRASAEQPPRVGRGPVRPACAAALRLHAALARLTPVLYLERAEPSSQRPPRRAPHARPPSLARGSSCPPAAARPARGTRPASAPRADPTRGGLRGRPGLAAPPRGRSLQRPRRGAFARASDLSRSRSPCWDAARGAASWEPRSEAVGGLGPGEPRAAVREGLERPARGDSRGGAEAPF